MMRVSNTQRRIAIAKDVLKQIRLKTIRPKAGHYIKAKLTFAPKGDEDIQALLQDGKIKKCEACALGSAFLSYARLYDNVKLGGYESALGARYEYDAASRWGATPALSGQRPTAVLSPVFGLRQMEVIEYAFESRSSALSWPLSDGDAPQVDLARAVAFGKKYRTDTQRLVAIMKNIVRNKGTFKP